MTPFYQCPISLPSLGLSGILPTLAMVIVNSDQVAMSELPLRMHE